MLKIALCVVSLVLFPITAAGGPKEDAQAVADKFIASFVAADLESTVGLFAPDALFWGTTMGELGTAPEAVRKYFAASYAARANTPVTSARIVDGATTILSDDAVLIAGRWQVERPNAISALRYTFVIHRKAGQWKIAHLHSSPRPAQ